MLQDKLADLQKIQKNLKKLEIQLEQRAQILLEKQHILEVIYDGIEKGITLIDKNYTIIKANRYIANLFGKKPEELAGAKCYQIFGEGNGEKCATCPADNTLKAGLPVSINRKIVTPQGKHIYLQNTTFPVLEKIKGIAGFIYYTEDITKHIELEKQLIQSEKFTALGKFASCVTHDLRNPLTVIRNACYYLKRKVSTNEEKIKNYLTIIEKETEKADSIIADLLSFSRSEDLSLKKIKVTDLLENLLVTLPIPKHIEIKKFYHDQSFIEADPDQLYRVFVNITKNAFEAMPDAGLFIITTKGAPSHFSITFQDNGLGIAEKLKKTLFEPFFSTKAKGIGLGLYICKSIIRQHKGTLEATSDIHKGASFTITLPK